MRDAHVVAFSGGGASAKVALVVANQHGEETTLLFHDTKTEPKDNDRFRGEVAKYLRLDITEHSDGRNIWQVFKDEGYLGNGRNTMCSRILKQELSLNYLEFIRDGDKYNEKMNPILYVGFTPDEWGRAQRVSARYEKHGIEVRYPLIEHNITKDECHKEIEACWGIKLPEMYSWASHANCVPCIKGKKAYWGLIYKYEREAWERAVRAEKDFGQTIFTEAGSLVDELDNCIRLADKHELKQTQESLFDTPCECMA